MSLKLIQSLCPLPVASASNGLWCTLIETSVHDLPEVMSFSTETSKCVLLMSRFIDGCLGVVSKNPNPDSFDKALLGAEGRSTPGSESEPSSLVLGAGEDPYVSCAVSGPWRSDVTHMPKKYFVFNRTKITNKSRVTALALQSCLPFHPY